MEPSSWNDLAATAPLVITACAALVVLTIDALLERSEGPTLWVALAGLVGAGIAAFASIDTPGVAFSGMVTTGGYASFCALVFCLSGMLNIMFSPGYLRKSGIGQGEYYALMLIAIVGMMLMAAAADLIVFFIGLETMSIGFYILAGFMRSRKTSNEAALKYFLLGAFATGFLLYGIALVYGSTGSTTIATVVHAVQFGTPGTMFIIGVALILTGLVFKVAAVPFHMWVPDVYEGAPTTVTGFMSTAGKAAAFSAFLLIFAPDLVNALRPVREVMAVLAMLSMIVGNVLAIAQSSIKRMLAYSSIAHAGYILVGIIAGNVTGTNGVLFYLVSYTVMNVGAFGVLSILESADGANLTFDDYAGLSARRPLLAGVMALFMFSLAGVPPFAGFFGKYYVFAAAVQSGYTWLAIVGVLMSVVSAYYYLRLVVLMYFKEQVNVLDGRVSGLGVAALLISVVAVIQFGVFPSSVLSLMHHLF